MLTAYAIEKGLLASDAESAAGKGTWSGSDAEA
jgi:hypothetical protein